MQFSYSHRRSINIWPGFVDALSALLIVIIFMLLIFMIGQFFLSAALTSKERTISELDQVTAQLTELLATEKSSAADLRHRLDTATAQLESRSGELATLQADTELLMNLRRQLEQEVAALTRELQTSQEHLSSEKQLSSRSLAQIELINRQIKWLRDQLGAIGHTLGIEMSADDEDLEAFTRNLNQSLLQMVQTLAHYRSDFFGRLRDVLGNHPNIEVVGDRFILQSELLFDTASATLGARGKRQVEMLARIINTMAGEIPGDIDWVVRIDGHTDRRQIRTAEFPSNWELSTARALAIVQFMIEQGVAPERLAATGFGEFHPLDPAPTPEAYARNRRIEIKLTAR
ncbi:MAG: peptidoglycan -binding protein [Gammaproteobacteria bacterium]|nr:peptidoglycan -binding protein [Gammaproteobacteria bacterium]